LLNHKQPEHKAFRFISLHSLSTTLSFLFVFIKEQQNFVGKLQKYVGTLSKLLRSL